MIFQNRKLFLPAVLGFSVIPFGWLLTLLPATEFGGFLLVSAAGGLLFYGFWWLLSKLCTRYTYNAPMTLVLLNSPVLLILSLLAIHDMTGIFNAMPGFYRFLMGAALPVTSLPMLMFPMLLNGVALYIIALVLVLATSFLGCASVRRSDKTFD